MLYLELCKLLKMLLIIQNINYKGYGICFDERSEFGHRITEGGHVHTTEARNVLIFWSRHEF